MTALGGGKARLRQALPAVAVLAILLLPGRAAATTFTPTTTADGVNGACTATLCTLRDAVGAVNAGTGGDAIRLPAGRYTLDLGELDVGLSFTIAGAGARTTAVDGQGIDRVFNTHAAADFRDLTVTGGNANVGSSFPTADGGGIVNQGGVLTLERVAVVGNRATLGGGGVNAPFEMGAPTIAITDSLIANNAVGGGALNGQGGGAALFGHTTITNTTITGNLVANPGANEGGGLVVARSLSTTDPASLTLLNTTIANNAVAGLPPAGATPNFGGGLSGDNLGGMSVLSELTARNTIIAGNTVDGASQDCALVNVNSTANNLSRDATCGFTDAGSKQNANPQLGPLANNGGPTNTLAIADGSPALNAGTNSGCPAADQRGVTRPQALTCDIGAYERRGPDLEVIQRVAKKRKGKGRLASPARRKRRKRYGFVVNVTNRGEQTATATLLTVKLPKRVGKVKLKGCESATKKKKVKKKGKRKRRRGKKIFGCSLGNVEPGTSKTVRIKFRPKRKRKIASKVSVTSPLGDLNPATDTARTKLRVKRKRKRKRR